MADKNVLLIVIDQLRADCVFGALSAHVDLPNMRALAAQGTAFENHFTVTSPCGPSRTSLLTGQYAMNHRSIRNGTPLRHDTPTLPGLLRDAGIAPLLFGYTDTSHDPRVHEPDAPQMRTYEYPMAGFEEVVEMRYEESHPWREYLKSKGYEFQAYKDIYKPAAPDGGAPKLNDPAFYRAEDSDTAYLTSRFIDEMSSRAPGWCAMLTYLRPHPPLNAPAPYNIMYDPLALPDPVGAAHGLDHPYVKAARLDPTPTTIVEGFESVPPTAENIQTLRALYLGLATEVDHHLGRVLNWLEATGQAKNTLVIVTADHGEMLGDHASWGKRAVFDASFHIPLIIRAPGAPRGQRIEQPCESVDVLPTILHWLDLTVPNSVDGCSLLPFVEGRTPGHWRGYSYSELDFADPEAPTAAQSALGTGYCDSGLAILRGERFTLVEFAADLPPILFDHDGQGELADVAADPAFAPDLARLTRELLRHRMRHADHALSYQMITADGPMHTARRSTPDAPQN